MRKARYALCVTLANVAAYSPLLILWSSHPYFRASLQLRDLYVLWAVLAIVLLLSIASCLFRSGVHLHRNLNKHPTVCALGTLLKRAHGRMVDPDQEENLRVFLLSLVIKVVFLPMMLVFFLDHAARLWQISSDILWISASRGLTEENAYWLLRHLIYLIDTCVFFLAYCLDSPFFGNRIKSVDQSVSGWVVALLCYPPFNDATSHVLVFHGGVGSIDWSTMATWPVWLGLGFHFLYLLATLSLGLRCGNLVNRGIVCHGTYAVVRHPAYVCKNLAWWLESLPFLSFWNAVALLGWGTIYWARAMTEERHLGQDEAYREYCRQVRWRFLPGLL